MALRPITSAGSLRNLLFVLSMVAASSANAQGPTYTDIHDFGLKITNANGSMGADGVVSGPITFDSAGNMYGATLWGGPTQLDVGFTTPNWHAGMVWEMTTTGVYKDLHDFGGTTINSNGLAGPDGIEPQCSIAIDSSGDLFGTASNGGEYGKGMIWEIRAGGGYFDLHDFGGTVTNSNNSIGPDGKTPSGAVAIDQFGDLYGTCGGGGPHDWGTIWAYVPAVGKYLDLHDFGGLESNGYACQSAQGGVILDSANNLYGTTYLGGSNIYGTVWEFTVATHTLAVLHNFGGTITNASGNSSPDGEYPQGAVTLDSSGNIFGQTGGLLWEISGTNYIDLHDFGGKVPNAEGTSGNDGLGGSGPVYLDGQGNIFGLAVYGGGYYIPGNGGNTGMIWELSASSVYTDLHDFGGPSVANIGGRNTPDGGVPLSFMGLYPDTHGNLYAATAQGGGNPYYNNAGNLFALGWLKSVSVVPTGVAAGTKSVGTITLGMAAPIGGTVVNLSSDNTDVAPPATVFVPAGSTTATFSILTNRITTAETATITATQSGTSVSTVLSVQPVTLAGFSYYPTPQGGTTESFTIDLTGPAPAGGLSVQLTSNSADVTVPVPPIMIPAGATSAPFTATLSTVSSNTSAIITATLGAVQKTAPLTIKAP